MSRRTSSSFYDELNPLVDLQSEFGDFDDEGVHAVDFEGLARVVLLAFSSSRETLPDLTLPGFMNQHFLDALCDAAPEFGLTSYSKVVGASKYYYLTKPRLGEDLIGRIHLTKPSEQAVHTLLERYPPMYDDVNVNSKRFQFFSSENRNGNGGFTRTQYSTLPSQDSGAICKLPSDPSPRIPPWPSAEYQSYRRSLPIWKHRGDILGAIQAHQIVVIKGDAGVGKTTQIPQYILDNAIDERKPVRVIVSLPRKIAVLAISERVAAERGERVGSTVGYQVKLESRISPCDTLLTYCSSNVLLRSITNLDYDVLKNTTHIVVDEAHVRDRYTDFILTCLREILCYFKHLHLIIVGADEHLDKISQYFGTSCFQLDIAGSSFEVQTKFLDEVLWLTNFQPLQEKKRRLASQAKRANCPRTSKGSTGKARKDSNAILQYENSSPDDVFYPQFEQERNERLDAQFADSLIKAAFSTKDRRPFDEFIDLVMQSQISIDYCSRETGVSIFMAAAAVGSMEYIKKLLSFGADFTMRANNGFSAKDFSKKFENQVIYDYLADLEHDLELNYNDPNTKLLSYYQRGILNERDHLDLKLILNLIHKIHSTAASSSGILVFLPGYEEIVQLKHMIFSDTDFQFRDHSFVLYLVHSNTQNGDQRSMFTPTRVGVRKILLATNIMENSLTFNDVVYVIDSGKERENVFNSSTTVGFSRFRYNWISKTSALQRKGRVGRCQIGFHFCLYSAKQFDSMELLGEPEVLKCSIQELCLQTSDLIGDDASISDFFAQLPDPPLPSTVDSAISLLKTLGALDESEELTPLGTHLMDFSIEPRLGKALLYSIVLKCLDPILTIVSTLAFRDPFEIPEDIVERKKSFATKKLFACNTFSDHVALLKAFQEWEQLKGAESEVGILSSNQFCSRHFISSATFDMIYGIRTQLLAQLRASGFVRCKGASDVRDLNRHSDNLAIVKAALMSALYPNVVKIDRSTMTLTSGFDHKIRLHHSSTLLDQSKSGIASIPSDWILYEEVICLETVTSIRGCTAVSPAVLALFGSSSSKAVPDIEFLNPGLHYRFGSSYQPQDVLLRINGCIALLGNKHHIQLIQQLVIKFNALVDRLFKRPGVMFTSCEESVLSTILLVLTSEDQYAGLLQTEGIGQWPKFAGGNLLSAPRLGYEKPERGTEEHAIVKTTSKRNPSIPYIFPQDDEDDDVGCR